MENKNIEIINQENKVQDILISRISELDKINTINYIKNDLIAAGFITDDKRDKFTLPQTDLGVKFDVKFINDDHQIEILADWSLENGQSGYHYSDYKEWIISIWQCTIEDVLEKLVEVVNNCWYVESSK
jgi:hypothetical protein